MCEMATELTLKRTFDAPRELVFKAWTDPQLMAKWWGPAVFTTPVCELEARPGGKLYIVMHGPAGSDFDLDLPTSGVFHEVEEPSRLVFSTKALEDENGDALLETLNTVTFAEQGGKTDVTLHIVVTKSAPQAAGALAGMEQGWSESLDKLNALLADAKADTGFTAEPGKQEVIITRLFDAPRHLVFKLMTDPKFIPQWWGPKYLTTTVERMDVRPGGSWRFIQRDDDGNQYAFHGVYHDITPSERLVYTFEFEGVPGHAVLETVTFEERDGQTFVTDRSVFQSVQDRDGMLKEDMQSGAVESMERLAGLLVKV
jgi:uncharacterized protein YndB with AHSA1/START domain